MQRVEVVLLTAPGCGFCDDAKTMLERLSSEFSLTLREIALDSSEGQELATSSGLLFPPGILLNGKAFSYGRPSERKLRRQLHLLGEVSDDHQPPFRPGSVTPQLGWRA